MFSLEKVYNTRSPILLEGETGTGKSVVAKKIHQNSIDSSKKFIHLNLATIREDLLESELFGHSKGAFTSALYNKKGYLDEVQDGILFLDEISELSLESQKKLLLILEEKKFYPVGSCHEKKFQGRIITASNRNLKKLTDKGLFRQDLFFRISVFYYRIAPLREDLKKKQLLWNFYFDYYKKQFNKIDLKFSEEVFKFLSHYPWPGNIRELKNFMEYTVSISDEIIQMGHLPSWFFHKKNEELEDGPILTTNEAIPSYQNEKFHFEKDFFTKALATFHGKINLTAKKLNISKATLMYKIRRYRINTHQIKADIKEEKFDQLKIINTSNTLANNFILL